MARQGRRERLQISQSWSHQELQRSQQIQAISAPTSNLNDDKTRWSFLGPGNPLLPSMTAIVEYGLNLPRQVVSNKFTRDLHIDGVDIFDVRLAQVMTGGLNNWGLRSLANGRHTVRESFKSRQEAITAGTLMRSLRGDSSSQGTGADLNASPALKRSAKMLLD